VFQHFSATELQDAAGKARYFRALLLEANARFRGEQAIVQAFSLSVNNRYRKQHFESKNDLNGVLTKMKQFHNTRSTFAAAFSGVTKIRGDWERVVGDPEQALTEDGLAPR
jgi:mannose/fructose/N-acetylgalactosamine-specific phosphotransferase system component IID